jgi:hypothetical protein
MTRPWIIAAFAVITGALAAAVPPLAQQTAGAPGWLVKLLRTDPASNDASFFIPLGDCL